MRKNLRGLLLNEADSQKFLQLKPSNGERVKKRRTSQLDLDFQATKLANQQLLNGYTLMSHPTSADYATTPLSNTTAIWATGLVFKMEIEHVFASNDILFQKIQLTFQKNVIQDKTYLVFENRYVKWVSVPSTKNLPGNAMCDVVANEIVVGYQCLDIDCGMVQIGCLPFAEGAVVPKSLTKTSFTNLLTTELVCPENCYMVGLECKSDI